MDEFSVLIAGGGVAALEAALTLADVAEGRARVELLAPEPLLWYRPTSVAEPFGLGRVRHFDLGLLAARAGAGMMLGTLTGVDADRRLARTATGAALSYDALLIACGAQPTVAIPGALTFRGPADSSRLRALVEELERGAVERVAFAVPSGSAWPLPAYELALMTARRLATTGTVRCEVSLITPEPRPLHLFGDDASDAVGGLLSDAGVVFVGGVYPVGHSAGRLLHSEGAIPADRVVALPRLRGTRIDGVVQTPDCFLPVDDHCGVVGTDWLFAAGDITAFTIKQGGIATQQAAAAAEAIAVLAGATLVPQPFRPVLRGLLLTGGQPTYLRHDLAKADDGDWASGAPIWWPPTKIVGRRLTPFLAEIAGEVEESHADLPPDAGIAVEVPIGREQGETLEVGLGF
jgi:sulfide:quinone oxidoreductase